MMQLTALACACYLYPFFLGPALDPEMSAPHQRLRMLMPFCNGPRR